MTIFFSDVEPFSKYSPVTLHLTPATIEPPRATTSHKRPPSQNTKNVLSQSVILEPLLVRVQILCQACEKPTG